MKVECPLGAISGRQSGDQVMSVSVKERPFWERSRRERATGEDPPPFLSLYYEQVLVAASHFMWAFSQADLFFGVSAANVGAVKATARPNATGPRSRYEHVESRCEHSEL